MPADVRHSCVEPPEVWDLPYLIRIAVNEALAFPGRAAEIVEDVVARARDYGEQVKEYAQVVEDQREIRREAERIAAESIRAAYARAERRAEAALAQLTRMALSEDGFDPRGLFVYCLWGEDVPQVPLYVGKSTNVLTRLGTHLGERGKRERIVRVTLLRCADAEQMGRTEARLIRHYRPPTRTTRRTLAAAAIVLALAGCSRPPKSGEVVSKSYEAPYTYYTSMCVAFNSNGTCMVSMPVPNNEPEHWVLSVRDDGDPKHVGKVRVDHSSWDQYSVGSHWPDAR